MQAIEQQPDPTEACTSLFDLLPADVATGILLSAGGPSHILGTRSTSKSWEACLNLLIRSAHLHTVPNSLQFLQQFPNLGTVDLSGCCHVLPARALETLMSGLAALPCLTCLQLSTWCLAQPACSPPVTTTAAAAAAAAISSIATSTSSGLPVAMPPAAAPAPAPAAAAGYVEVRYTLTLPRELALLSSLQQLIIRPCPVVSPPVVDRMLMCPQIMQMTQLTHLELHTFLPHCHHLRGLQQLQHLAVTSPTITSTAGSSSNGSSSSFTGARAAAAVWDAAAAALSAATGLTSLQLQLHGPSVAGNGHETSWAGTDWPSALDALICRKTPASTSRTAPTDEATYSSGSGSSSSSAGGSCTARDVAADAPQADQQLHLRQLSVAGAGLWHLPAAIHSCCSGLTSLVLSNNRLSEVGLEILGGAHQLRELLLDHNCLRALPSCWTALHQLQVLDLTGNAIGAYPAAMLSAMGQLQVLLLGSNSLALLPESISSLSCLQVLDLSSNRLQELPEGVCSCRQLRRLHVARNRLVQLPLGLQQLTAVTQLDLTGNHLECLPVGLNQMRWLDQLSLGLNYYKTWCNLDLPCLASSLRLLELQHTATCLADAHGFLAAVGRLTLLTELCCSNNQLVQLPDEWSNLRALQVLRVAHNALEELPAGLLLLPALTSLDMSYNRVRALPVWVSELSHLRQFSLARNHLASLPAELASLSLLSQLQLQGNNLAAVPRCLGRLSALRVLNVSANYKLKEAGMSQLLELQGLRDVVLPYRLREIGQQLRAAGKAVTLE